MRAMRSPRSGWLARPIPGKSIARTSTPLRPAAYPTTGCGYSRERRSTTRRGCIDSRYDARIPGSRAAAPFDVRSAFRPRLIGNAHVHVALEATVCRKESTGTHRSLRALVEDLLPQSTELRSDRCGQRGGNRIDLEGIGRAASRLACALRDQHDDFQFRHRGVKARSPISSYDLVDAREVVRARTWRSAEGPSVPRRFSRRATARRRPRGPEHTPSQGRTADP